MRKSLKKLSTLFLIALLFGCASREETTSYQALKLSPGYSLEETTDNNAGQVVVDTAKTAIGTPYVRGGSKPGGFDCSGFVMWAYNRVGVKLPRTAREQSTVGEKITNPKDMQPGDIVAFHHPKRGYHTGIYVGDGKFIHSPRTRSSVKISSLDSNYFSSTLLGARRVKFDCDESVLVAAATNLPEAYTPVKLGKASTKMAKFKRSAKSSRKAGVVKRSGKTGVKAIASSKKANSKTIKTAKNSKVGKSVKATAAKSTPSIKKNSKIIAQHTNRSKTTQAAKTQKKSGTRTVSMLHRKTR